MHTIDARAARVRALRNLLESLALLGALCAVFASVAFLAAGAAGLWAGAGAAALLVAAAPALSSGALRLLRARPLAGRDAPRLRRLAAELSGRARLPRPPELFLVPDESARNAFATGSPRRPCIALSAGLLRGLDERELAGVLAHELAHIAHGDLQIVTLAQLLGNLAALLAHALQLVLLLSVPLLLAGRGGPPPAALPVLAAVPLAALLLRLRLSRIRELDADLAAVRLTGDPEALASALHKLAPAARGPGRMGQAALGPGWLRTHPEPAERIARILSLAKRD